MLYMRLGPGCPEGPGPSPKPFEEVLKDGFALDTCVKDYMYYRLCMCPLWQFVLGAFRLHLKLYIPNFKKNGAPHLPLMEQITPTLIK